MLACVSHKLTHEQVYLKVRLSVSIPERIYRIYDAIVATELLHRRTVWKASINILTCKLPSSLAACRHTRRPPLLCWYAIRFMLLEDPGAISIFPLKNTNWIHCRYKLLIHTNRAFMSYWTRSTLTYSYMHRCRLFIVERVAIGWLVWALFVLEKAIQEAR